jgi:hypothetical protein
VAVYEQPFDPTQRVVKAAAAFKSVGDGIRTKGFLGRSLREDNSVPSVGVTSARRAGVIVDENGKMRCPAGTPNANQFTDINMSNCMVPSAQTAANEAARAAADGLKKLAGGFNRGFLRPKSSKDEKQIVDSGVGFSDAAGRLEIKPVPSGAIIKDPKTGESKVIESSADAIKHIGDGGSLSDIPDEYLMAAIVSNSGRIGLFGRKPRFKVIGSGGGVNGMTRLEDTITGNMIGYKYKEAPSFHIAEPLNEVMGEHFSQALGFEPIPMRIVPAEYNGVTLVSELVHNRRSGKIHSVERNFGPYTITKTPENIDKESLWTTALFDSIMVNGDRHTGNFLLETDGGVSYMVPIDNSLGFDSNARNDALFDDMYRPDIMVEVFKQAYFEDVANDEALETLRNIQTRLKEINTDELRKKADELIAVFEQMQTQRDVGAFDDFNAVSKRKQIEDSILRLEYARSISAQDLFTEIIGKEKINEFDREKMPVVSSEA